MPTALLSVYDKSGICAYAGKLERFGWNILASGGTATRLGQAGIRVIDIATRVGPPMLKHKVVSLAREIHAGLLADDSAEESSELAKNGIQRIDLVYVTLYPLIEELGKQDATIESVREKTDIGGPAMLRSAAKGRRLVITNENDARRVMSHLESNGGIPVEDKKLLRYLACVAERKVAAYALASAIALSNNPDDQDDNAENKHLRGVYRRLTDSALIFNETI
ncbi:MAG TPA: hypothetical protein VJI96_02225 [Candidatus Andersenbacteria bacterium]|nr:hypothetical protein [Candidatus Andersenbacteria bacterium]